jgi:hypothetical protein
MRRLQVMNSWLWIPSYSHLPRHTWTEAASMLLRCKSGNGYYKGQAPEGAPIDYISHSGGFLTREQLYGLESFSAE